MTSVRLLISKRFHFTQVRVFRDLILLKICHNLSSNFVIIYSDQFISKETIYIISFEPPAKSCTKIYSLAQCSLTVNECDCHILTGNDEMLFSEARTNVLSHRKMRGTS